MSIDPLSLPNEKHDYILEQHLKCLPWALERNHFFETLCAAEFQWFFVQGLDAIKNGLYIPGISSLLNGIEASLRVTIAQVSTTDIIVNELSPYKVLSNPLINNALELGLPVHALAFPGEVDFLKNLKAEKKDRVDVEVVRQRNNICHGNIFEFINRDLGPENSFFTPHCMKQLAITLIAVSHEWAEKLGQYRRTKNLLHYDK